MVAKCALAGLITGLTLLPPAIQVQAQDFRAQLGTAKVVRLDAVQFRGVLAVRACGLRSPSYFVWLEPNSPARTGMPSELILYSVYSVDGVRPIADPVPFGSTPLFLRADNQVSDVSVRDSQGLKRYPVTQVGTPGAISSLFQPCPDTRNPGPLR